MTKIGLMDSTAVGTVLGGISEQTVRKLSKDGSIPGPFMLSRKWSYWEVSEIEKVIRNKVIRKDIANSGRPDKNTFMYVISTGVHGDPVKIGVSQDPHERARSMSTGSPRPLSVAYTVRGNVYQERVVHHNLDCHRSHGEWFNVTVPDAIDAITSVKEGFYFVLGR